VKKTRISVAIVLAIVGLSLLSATPAYADTPLPDEPPSVEDIYIYRNLLETGDVLILIYANIPYADIPDTLVTQAFIWRLFDVDGETKLGTTTGNAYNDSGYGYNLFSFYFDAEYAGDSLTWGQPYTIRLNGNPSAFGAPPTYNFQITAADYTTLTESTEVKAELATCLLDIASDLDIRWGLTSENSLLAQLELGTVLSVYTGEVFFRTAIYGIQAMAPSIFRFVLRDTDAPDREWELEYSEDLTEQWNGTWIDTAREANKALFGKEYDLVAIIIIAVLCLGLLIGNIMLTGDAWNGMIDALIIFILGARLGMYGLGYLGLIAALCVIYTGAKIWGIAR